MKRMLAFLVGLVVALAGIGCDWDVYTDYGYYPDYGYYYDFTPIYYGSPFYCETVCDPWGCWEECY